jgi:hypothetical protein
MNFARKNKVAKAAIRLEEVSLIAGHFLKPNLLGLPHNAKWIESAALTGCSPKDV